MTHYEIDSVVIFSHRRDNFLQIQTALKACCSGLGNIPDTHWIRVGTFLDFNKAHPLLVVGDNFRLLNPALLVEAINRDGTPFIQYYSDDEILAYHRDHKTSDSACYDAESGAVTAFQRTSFVFIPAG